MLYYQFIPLSEFIESDPDFLEISNIDDILTKIGIYQISENEDSETEIKIAILEEVAIDIPYLNDVKIYLGKPDIFLGNVVISPQNTYALEIPITITFPRDLLQPARAVSL